MWSNQSTWKGAVTFYRDAIRAQDLAVSPDGTLYAASFAHGNPPTPDPSLMVISPEDRTVDVAIEGLGITSGTMAVLP